MPDKADLNSKGELALLGFGQGKLTSSPLQMCYALCTIANGGMKNQVHFLLSSINDKGYKNKYIYKSEEHVLSGSTSVQMLKNMRYVVTNGTGKPANDTASKAAGKTATAQTGRYFLGKEYLNTWFAGVYPYNSPKYAIVILCEDGKSGSEDCAPIYRYIVEKLNNI
jgi:cell division protein FtsI/penicillin-binding protein 2